MSLKYVHTNIVAKDWKKLAEFYIEVLECKPVFPERNLEGRWIDVATGLKSINIKGIHLRLPGYDINGPTLEIFQYSDSFNTNKRINNSGLAHLAFLTDNVEKISEEIIVNGGEKVGDLVKKEIPEVGLLTFQYLKDPEGNIIEIQNWSKNIVE